MFPKYGPRISHQGLNRGYVNYLNGINGILKHPHILTKLHWVCGYDLA